MRRRRLKVTSARKGFSLIELVIALLMLSFGLLSLAGAMASTIVGQRVSSSRGELAVVAEAKLEELRGIGSAPDTSSLRVQLVTGGSVTASAAGYSDSVQTADNRWYLRRWTVSNGVAGTRRVTIRVSPMRRERNELRFESYTTLIALR